jgi:aminopeptidase
MHDERVEKLAELIVSYSIDVQPGEKVAIRSQTPAAPLLNALQTHILQSGGYPFYLLKFPETEELLFTHASDDQLTHTPDVERFIIDTFDAVILVRGEVNTKSLSNIPPHKLMLAQQAEAPLMQKLMQRAASGTMKWVSALFPTNAYAQDAHMSLRDYENFVYQACLPDLNDPVGYWQGVEKNQAKIVEWLKGKNLVHIVGPETDLHLSIEGRRFDNSCCKHNVPDGEIYTGPVENSANGYVNFSYPAIYNGHEIAGARLWFEEGRVVRAEADKNEAFLLAALETDPGARYLGEFAIGTNDTIDRFTGQILFDEKIGGSFHLALGNSYPQTGGVNKSAIHWDLICDLRTGGSITVDGECIYQDGKFIIGKK